MLVPSTIRCVRSMARSEGPAKERMTARSFMAWRRASAPAHIMRLLCVGVALTLHAPAVAGAERPVRLPSRPLSPSSPSSPAPMPVASAGREAREWAIDRVVIDPGHGGHDTGALGPTGLREKDIALLIARRLAARLSSELGVKTILTRSRDQFVGLQDRYRAASVKARGKLFISIHCNASRDPNSEGFEVYFLSEAKTDDAREVALRENESFMQNSGKRAGGGGLPGLVGEILLGMESDQYLKESQDLASMVVDQVVCSTALKSRGVKQAGFAVMKGTLATMPSILVETAFISNPREERRLRNKEFREELVGALVRAVANFKRKYEDGGAEEKGRQGAKEETDKGRRGKRRN